MTTIETFHNSSVTAVASPPPLPAQSEVTATTAFPVVTTVILIAIGLIFGAEVAFGVAPWSGALGPDVTTLQAFGGLQYPLVVDQGQWFRLFSAPLLHLDISHVLINGVVFLFAGRALEGMIGRLWFAAVFTVGGVAGGAASLLVNAHNIVSVGASGAIMAILAATFVLSFHRESGPSRLALQILALRFLIPSLIPLGVSASSSSAIDYGAHFGGAIAGAIMGGLLLAIWSRDDVMPALSRVATVIVALGLLATSYSAVANAHEYRIYNMKRLLIPAAEIPENYAAILAKAPDLLKRYPSDPRAHLYEAIALAKAKNLPGAEEQMRIGLAEQDILRVLLVPSAKTHLQAYLALVLSDEHRKDEAVEYAKAGCLDTSAALHAALTKTGLCEKS
jgi:rhomboid protease GluP